MLQDNVGKCLVDDVVAKGKIAAVSDGKQGVDVQLRGVVPFPGGNRRFGIGYSCSFPARWL
jgi:hypothetical protein